MEYSHLASLRFIRAATFVDEIFIELKEVIALTLDSRLSADFRQKREKERQKVDRLN